MVDWAAGGWECSTLTPQMTREYTIRRCPLLESPAYELSILDEHRLRAESRVHLINWAVSKGFVLEHMGCGIIDMHNKHIYPVEMITSRRGKPCLMVILYTKKRIPRGQFVAAIDYASTIHGVCIEQYAISATTIVVNAFFDENGVGVSGVNRVSWARGVLRPNQE